MSRVFGDDLILKYTYNKIEVVFDTKTMMITENKVIRPDLGNYHQTATVSRLFCNGQNSHAIEHAEDKLTIYEAPFFKQLNLFYSYTYFTLPIPNQYTCHNHIKKRLVEELMFHMREFISKRDIESLISIEYDIKRMKKKIFPNKKLIELKELYLSLAKQDEKVIKNEINRLNYALENNAYDTIDLSYYFNDPIDNIVINTSKECLTLNKNAFQPGDTVYVVNKHKWAEDMLQECVVVPTNVYVTGERFENNQLYIEIKISDLYLEYNEETYLVTENSLQEPIEQNGFVLAYKTSTYLCEVFKEKISAKQSALDHLTSIEKKVNRSRKLINNGL